jgi:predicted MFS family arabinose efflux permease
MRRPVVALGMIAVSLFFMGQFALFTYLRPFLETVTHVSVSGLSLLLLALGVAGFAGTTLIGRVIGAGLYRTLLAAPLLMAATGAALVVFGHSLPMVGALLLAWGLVGTSAPVAWWTWLARTLPDDAEAGGGLMVAVVQLAIMLGATVGGVVFDTSGYRATFYLSAAIMLLAALFTALAARAANAGRA